MGQVSNKLRSWESPSSGDGGFTYWCQGCNSTHSIKTRGPGSWGWNGDVERPTFTPSVLLSGVRMTEKGEADWKAWVDAGCPKPSPGSFDSAPHVCHSFVTDGRVQFLTDSRHALAGQTVELADLPDHLRDDYECQT